jgi:hypothetical protein
MKPYAYKTTDFGQTWTPLVAANSTVSGYAHVIKVDPVQPQILYLGTEFGLWITLDEGKQWAQFKGGNFPGGLAVHDIAIQQRDNDLVLATHGRGIWIIDDITPLRKLTAQILNSEAAFVPGRPAVQSITGFGGWALGDADFTAPNAPDNAVITYYQQKRHIFGDLKIEILDPKGNVLDSVPGSKGRGLSRTEWSMRLKPPKFPPAAAAAFATAFGPRVLPGTYTVRMTKDKKTYTTQIELALDPRAKFTIDDRKAQFELAMRLYRLCERMAYNVEAIQSVRQAAAQRMQKLGANDPARKQLQALADKANAIRSKIVATKEGGAITGEERIRENVADVYGSVNNYEGRPTTMQVMRTEALEKELSDVWAQFQTFAAHDLAAANAVLKTKNLPAIQVPTEAEWQKTAVATSARESEAARNRFERD